uniref:Uncharacterized protein n=1 Tax=Cairina moschata TaxID=8855 RepID=A0A8C3BH42_CAIMO
IALRAAKAEELSLNKEKQDLRLRLRELILETDKLKDDLCEKMKENNKQQEEIIHLKQENVFLKNELALNVEKAKRKDQLLQFAKSKQVRTDTELSSLRQIYVKQQRDLQFLHVNLENSQELRQKHEKMAYERRYRTLFFFFFNFFIYILIYSPGDFTVEPQLQDVASSSDELDSKLFYEANNTRLLRNREISEDEVESRDQQTFESSSPEYWLNITSCVDSQNTLIQNATSDKADNENKIWEERTGILFGQKSKETSVAIHTSESESFSSNFILKKDARWKPVSDPEWLKIFKPVKGNGSKLQRKDCNCPKTAEEMKYDACYPTSKLQRALAESQQMVADLELSTLLHMSPHCKLVYYAGYICGKEDSTGNGDIENGFV